MKSSMKGKLDIHDVDHYLFVFFFEEKNKKFFFFFFDVVGFFFIENGRCEIIISMTDREEFHMK
jgi:hypothetical protein